MLVSEMISDIGSRDLVLPEFQREYVWSREQAKQLLVSLTHKYPVGGLLFWKTQEPPELKNVKVLPPNWGTVRVILDGQQRLTTLYMFVTGEIPPYYTKEDITTDVRNLYFNVADGDFQYYQPVRMRDNPRWVRVVDCFNGDSVSVFSIAKKTAGDDQGAFHVAEEYASNLRKLTGISGMDIPTQVVPATASINEAINVFDRVNSLGTKLTDADLALTHVTGNWAQARRTLKSKMDDLETKGFGFDLTFMTRALVCSVTGHALFEHVHTVQRPQLEEGWAKLSKALDYTTAVLPSSAHIHSTGNMSSANPLIPIVRFLILNGGKFPSNASLRSGIHWLYLAQIHQRYAGQTDSRMEHDVTIVNREGSPWQSLLDQIVVQRGRVEVLPDDFEGRGVGHPLYRMTLILAKAHGAVDWFNGIPLDAPAGDRFGIHSHHIFPSSALYKHEFSSASYLDRQIVNAIANRAFLTGPTNMSLGSRLPEDYLPEVEDLFPGALASQFVPMDPQLWRLDRYRDFLRARRELISNSLNFFLEGLVSEEESEGTRPLSDLIEMGEGLGLEFKSSLQWDVVQGRQNKDLREASLKTIAAFMNSEGGTLLIGVEDSGAIFGLERDISLLEGSADRFLQLIGSLVAGRIGAEFSQNVDVRLDSVDGKPICVVDVSKSPVPAYVSGQRGSEFYVRLGNSTRSLDPQQTHAYLEQRDL